MAEFDPDAPRRGFESALAIIQSYEWDVPQELLGDSLNMASTILDAYRQPLSTRFVEGFFTSVAIAAAARQRYNEAPLRHEEISNYLRASASFFNSWTHPE
jgi:hypothetical protein